jgi:hypothetical protein
MMCMYHFLAAGKPPSKLMEVLFKKKNAGKHSSSGTITVTHICLESCVHRCPALWERLTWWWGLVELQSEDLLMNFSVGVRHC